MTTPAATILELCDQVLELAPGERDEFLRKACAGDIGLRAQVDSILIAIDGSEAFLTPVTDAAHASLEGQMIGRWQVKSLLGEGGMGSVYHAERRDGFDQSVAIKIVHSHLGSRELIRRFEAERQILAKLSHPYVAALLDGGTTSTGLPYLVMEHIDGEPVDRYCDQRCLTLDDRIRLLLKVIAAVQAAHQNLIVHRDLKPSNVLVTADGIPKLLDFGIAKLLHGGPEMRADGNTTVFGQQALTPDYASPEQILTNEVTTVSDIYSLGILSYQVLTGERPYYLTELTQQGLVAEVQTLAIPKPSKRLQKMPSLELRAKLAEVRKTTPARLARRLEGDLDKILLKALHRNPARRYQSVAELKNDFENYLDGLPVSAQADSAWYRTSRFIRRNKIAVAGASLVLLSLLGGLGSTWIAYKDAQAARTQAAARYGELRTLTNTLMFDIHDDIARIPGTVTAQKKLLGIAQQYVGSLATDQEAPLDVQLDAASGYARVFRLLQSPAVASTADEGAARNARERAEALFDRLSKNHPESAEVWLEYGRFLSALANESLYTDNDPQTSRELLERARLQLAQHASLAGQTTEGRVAELQVRVYLADTYKWETEYVAARPVIYAALEEIGALLRVAPEDEAVLRVAGEAYLFAGQLSWFLDEFDSGIAHYGEASRYFAAISERYSGALSPVADFEIDTDWSLANTLVDSGQAGAAEPVYRRALERVRLRVARDPDDQELARRFAILRGSLSAALVRNGKSEEAIARMQEVNAWFSAQAAAAPDSPSAQRSLAVSYHMMANIYDDAGRPGLYCEWLEKTNAKWAHIEKAMGLSDFDKEQPAIIDALKAEHCAN